MEKEVEDMCSLSQGVENRGIRKGREEEKLHSIRSLMEKLGFTMKQAMDALGVPESEQEKYAQLLKR